MNARATTTFKRRAPLAAILLRISAVVHRRLLALRHKSVPMQQSPFASAMASLPPDQQRDLDELLHRGLRSWEQPPAWIVQWHDVRAGVPAPVQRPVLAREALR